MFIDGMNLFIRAFAVNQTTNANGDIIGGTLGFLKSLKNLTHTFLPKKVFIVWEQGGACPRRKKIYPEYKANRMRQKDFSELYSEDGRFHPSADAKNKAYQLELLTKALNNLPVCQLYVPEVECDDIIAWLCKAEFCTYEGDKIIVSSDKDFYQLFEDPRVKIYDPGRKCILDDEYVKGEFSIAPRNIALARCLAGDPSDNIGGIPGVGLKTVSKRFTAFADDSVDLNIDWLINESKVLYEGCKRPPRCYQDIVENRDIIERNWKLMFLDINCLTATQLAKLEYRLGDFFPKINKMNFLKIIAAAGIPISKEMDDVAEELKYLIVG